MTHSHRDITGLLAAHGLAPRRAFGQNFVSDPNTVRRIARMANVGPNDHVVEIGAGLGSLTLALAETGARITAIEIDHGIAPVLRDVVKDLPNVSVVVGDALELGRLVDHVFGGGDFAAVVQPGGDMQRLPLVRRGLEGGETQQRVEPHQPPARAREQRRLSRTVLDCARAAGLGALDLFEAIDEGVKRDGYAAMFRTSHPGPLGHRIASERIAAASCSTNTALAAG